MSATEPKADIVTAILCDDIRKEQNGKDILIGVYGGSLLVKNLPTELTLCLWLYLKTSGDGQIEFEVRVLGPAGNPITAGNVTANLEDKGEGYGTLALQGMPLTLEKTGRYKFQYRKPKGRWSTILDKRVSLQQ